MRTDEEWEDGSGDPSWASPYVDGAWGRTANPNSAAGELQNIAAFSAGATRLTGPRRLATRLVVWAILLGFSGVIVFGVIGIVRIW